MGLFSFFSSFSELIFNYPFGIPFYETTQEKLDSSFGHVINFTPIYAAESGGLIAFFSYIFVYLLGIYFCLKNIILSKNSFVDYEFSVYFLILFVYILQRASILESAIFPLLFGTILIKQHQLKNKNNYVKQ